MDGYMADSSRGKGFLAAPEGALAFGCCSHAAALTRPQAPIPPIWRFLSHLGDPAQIWTLAGLPGQGGQHADTGAVCTVPSYQSDPPT
jgi:hypothetical protein